MSTHRYKKVQAQSTPAIRAPRTVRQLVTEFGDQWQRVAGADDPYEWAMYKTVSSDYPHDHTDFYLMKWMEQGKYPRVEE